MRSIGLSLIGKWISAAANANTTVDSISLMSVVEQWELSGTASFEEEIDREWLCHLYYTWDATSLALIIIFLLWLYCCCAQLLQISSTHLRRGERRSLKSFQQTHALETYPPTRPAKKHVPRLQGRPALVIPHLH